MEVFEDDDKRAVGPEPIEQGKRQLEQSRLVGGT
jgi:hypothetical protein